MPLISIITAAQGPTAQFLPDAITSVLQQSRALTDGWELEYVIQEDGADPVLQDLAAQDKRIQYLANDGQLGVATTRNIALSRVKGELVQMLDHDDLLLPGALATIIPRFLDLPIHWAIGQADDLLPDGSRKAYPAAVPFGLLPACSVNDWARDHDGNWPVHCAALMARTSTVRALGGWGATPSDDDIHIFTALFELTSGYHESAFTWLYRQHPQQAHRTDEWSSRSHDGRRIALQRLMALRAVGLALRNNEPLHPHTLAEETIFVSPSLKC